MLVRKQILLEEKQVLELEELAEMAGISVSKLIRNLLATGIETEKEIVSKNKKMSGLEFVIWLAEHPIPGPKGSEYDKYAYDW